LRSVRTAATIVAEVLNPMRRSAARVGKVVLTVDGVVGLVITLVRGFDDIGEFIATYAGHLVLTAVLAVALLLLIDYLRGDELVELPDDARVWWVVVGLCFIPAGLAAFLLLPPLADFFVRAHSPPAQRFLFVAVLLGFAIAGWIVALIAPATARLALGAPAATRAPAHEEAQSAATRAPAHEEAQSAAKEMGAREGSDRAASEKQTQRPPSRTADPLASVGILRTPLCPACHHPHGDTDAACEKCGHSGWAACPRCLLRVPRGAPACEGCGQRLMWKRVPRRRR
jgi:hypothetical protein